MILYCEHRGGGEESFGPVAEIDLAGIARDLERTSGPLRATLDYIDPSARGAAARILDGRTQDHTNLTVACECGAALIAQWEAWLGLEVAARGAGIERMEILAAKRAYEDAARRLRIGASGR